MNWFWWKKPARRSQPEPRRVRYIHAPHVPGKGRIVRFRQPQSEPMSRDEFRRQFGERYGL